MKTSVYIILTVILLCNCSVSKAPIQSETEPIVLEELTSFTQSYYYSEGHKERAQNIATFLENAGNFFQTEIGFTPKTKIYILAPQDWKDYAATFLIEVYGFPHNMAERLVIAAEDNEFWRSFLPPIDQLSPAMAAQVQKAYLQTDGSYSMMPFFDLLALHELGHAYTEQAGLKMHRHWMGELFVNVMLHTYVAEQQPELLPALETFPDMVVGGGCESYKFTSLQDFEKLYETLGMGPKNYGWYQSKLHSAAKDIYNAGGKDILSRLWKALKLHQEEMPDEAFINMLKTEVDPVVANVFIKWNQ